MDQNTPNLLSVEDAAKEFDKQLRDAGITRGILFNELWQKLWSKDDNLLVHGIWLTHRLTNLGDRERMVIRKKSDGPLVLITQPESDPASPVHDFRWLANGAGVVYHGHQDIPRPPDKFFQDFQEILNAHKITVLGIGPDPLVDAGLPGHQVFARESVPDIDRTWSTTIRERDSLPPHVGISWGFFRIPKIVSQNDQSQIQRRFAMNQLQPDFGPILMTNFASDLVQSGSTNDINGQLNTTLVQSGSTILNTSSVQWGLMMDANGQLNTDVAAPCRCCHVTGN